MRARFQEDIGDNRAMQTNPSPNTQMPNHSNADPAELAKFSELAHRWWDKNSEFKPLHEINPLRLEWMKAQTAFEGKRVLDVGCGGGILSDAMARSGAEVMGIDLATKALSVAKLHALEAETPNISYREVSVEDLAAEQPESFDVVTCMEVIEHVMDPGAFVVELFRHLKSDGLLLLSTPNPTAASRIFLVEAAERLGQVPRGTHDWDKFLTPEKLTTLLEDFGLEVVDMKGIAFSPMSGLHLSSNMALNYILSARLRG